MIKLRILNSNHILMVFVFTVLFFFFQLKIASAEQIPGFASPDLDLNSVPDYLELVVTNNDWFTTITMPNGTILQWADVTLTLNLPYSLVLSSQSPENNLSWQEGGWRFATGDELWTIFKLFGAKYDGPQYSSKHVATDMSLLFGDTSEFGPSSTQYNSTNLDMISGYLYSPNSLTSVNLGVTRDTSVTTNLSLQTYVLNSSPKSASFVSPNTGAWLVRDFGNHDPVLLTLSNQTITEGTPLQFTLSATDADNDTLTYSAANLPNGAVFDAQTQTFSWTPGYNDSGTYEVTFTVTDDGEPVVSDTETITITVENSNRTPVLNSVGNKIVSEGEQLQFVVSASDPDNDILTYTASNLPQGATFNQSTQTFSWTPGYTNEGNYTDIEFAVMDNGTPMELAVELITITVGNVNRAPTLTNPGPQEVLEAVPLSFTISATDPDNDAVTIIATNLPSGATFDGTNFFWTPSLTQEGIYTVTFTATDSGTPNEDTTLDVIITVGDSPTPVEQAEHLVDTVVTYNLPQNVENSYLANLQKVAEFIMDGKVQAARNQLNAFIGKVQQDYQKGKLTASQYTTLMNLANTLLGGL